MASTWTLAAIPFFSIRQLILYSKPIPQSLHQSDKNNMTASAISGAFLGIGTGYYWSRGNKYALIPAACVQSVLAIIAQTVATSITHKRIAIAIKKLENPQEPDNKVHWKNNLTRLPNGKDLPDRSQSDMDPMKHLIESFRNVFINTFFPDSPSYVIHATDLEYRRKLNLKIAILSDQIQELKEELESKQIKY
jgi:hypothetical protein